VAPQKRGQFSEGGLEGWFVELAGGELGHVWDEQQPVYAVLGEPAQLAHLGPSAWLGGAADQGAASARCEAA
jgi:hypothetical protein